MCAGNKSYERWIQQFEWPVEQYRQGVINQNFVVVYCVIVMFIWSSDELSMSYPLQIEQELVSRATGQEQRDWVDGCRNI